MEVMYERCAGLDVHKKVITACLIVPGPDGKPKKETRTFGTMTRDILMLSDWLSRAGCTHVAMESTGVYWKPVYNILESNFEVVLANAAHIKNVPGRKTDISDAEWIADLLRHGLIRGSFIPPEPIRELRDLTRYRTSLTRQKASEVNRLQKILEDANIKLASVATDVTGVSARSILHELLRGEMDAESMAQLARGRMRKKIPELQRALEGFLKPHHRLIISQILAHIDYLDEAIAELDREIEERMRPFEADAGRLDGVPGLDVKAIQGIIAEIGVDMTVFPSDRHIASWAGVCPGNNESAGKRKSGKTTKGNPWLKSLLVQAAHAAGRSKGNYLSSLYHRLAARKGKKRAAVAVAHATLTIVYHILRDKTVYRDLGADYFDRLDREAVARRLTKRLEALGYKVDLQDLECAA